ncbi:MAG: bacteriochlorophyll 4-vinyl reductase [Rhodobacterales bacterium]|nr:bacteriochlorophyll 4-vinyl reductase [Rhodobacterales bacterium]
MAQAAAGPDGAARIGPNAVLQLLPVLTAQGGAALAGRLLGRAGLVAPPPDTAMMPETPAARLHAAVRAELGRDSAAVLAAAGAGTGAYILAHRIPRAAQAVLRALPAGLAAPILTQAIAQNAWTFAGSGRFCVVSRRPVVVTLEDNPLIRGEVSDAPLCHWHRAVFDTLYGALAGPGWRARETECCACGDPACRFEIGPG